MPTCPEHNLEAVVKDNVRNKQTGRLYPPFYACPWKQQGANGMEYCNFRFTEKPNQSAMMSHGSAAAQGGKDSQIKYMNALNCATQLLSTDPGDIKDKLIALKVTADEIYKMNAPV